MNFIETFEKGQEGNNFGLDTGLVNINQFMGGVQKKSTYTVAGAPKSGKCLAFGTKVIMYDLSLKRVEELKKGDFLLGLDGKPNKIISTTKGQEMMYWVHQSKAISYRVNESHILSLKNKNNEIKNISLLEYNNLSRKEKTKWYGYKSCTIQSEQSLEIDPYLLGLWLGDGSSAKPQITNTDEEIINWLKEYCINKSYNLKTVDDKEITYNISANTEYYIYKKEELFKTCKTSQEVAKFLNTKQEYVSRSLVKYGYYNCMDYTVTRRNNISLQSLLNKYNLLKNKHIPIQYLKSSEKQRLDLLAGIIDSDGSLSEKRTHYEIILKSKKLITDVNFLANSLGFNTSLKEKLATMKGSDGSIYSCVVYRLFIKGNCYTIPCKVARKKAKKPTKSTNSRIKIVKDKIDDYYGFTLENDDKRFYLKDFTVTHNTALVDNLFLINPFIDSLRKEVIDRGITVDWIYFSYEIDRMKKQFRLIPYFIFKEFGVTHYEWKGQSYPINPMFFEGKLQDEDRKTITASPKMKDGVLKVYEKWIKPLFGEYDEKGNCIRKGKIDFIEDKMNPTGMYHYLMDYADRNGKFLHETYTTQENGRSINKSRISGYKPNDPNKFTIVITDHMRNLKREKGYSLKENVDRWSGYQVDLRNLCGFTFVNVIHTNRSLGDVDRIQFMSDELYPTAETIKDTGNLSEDSNFIITLFNPRDEKYKIRKHFNCPDVRKYPNIRSWHLVESRDTECPVHTHLNFKGNLGLFEQLNIN